MTPLGVRLERVRPKQARQELFFHAVLASAPLGVVVASTTPDGDITYVNPEFTRVTGYTQQDIPTVADWLRRAYPDEAYRATVLASWPEDVDPANSGRDVVFRVTCKDGTRKEVQLRAGPLGPGEMIVTLLDITHQRRTEARLTSIIHAAPMGVGLVARDARRTLKWVNEVVCGMVGYERDELVGQSARIFYADDAEFSRVGQVKYREMASHGVGSVETRWRAKDGRMVDVLLSSSPLDAADPQSEVTFTALDITERVRAAREQEELGRRVVQTQKLESLGVLAGGIAHDFNNLLLGILGNADLALMDLPVGAPARASVAEIEAAARRASELSRQMLAYSGRSRFVVQALDMNELVRDARQLLEVAISKKAALRLELAPELPRVEADPAQLRQMLMSLVTNASESLGDRPGEIRIVTGVRRCERVFLARTYVDDQLPAGEYVFVEVRDTGCGMDEATRERIFDPFFTTKFPGRGLGLAAVLGITRGHAGAIRVDTAPGQGTVVTALLPSQQDSQVVTNSKPVLQRMGYEVTVAADGAEAVDLFRERDGRFACVLLDLTMPRMDGVETMEAMQRVRPDVCVLLSSGYGEAEVKERFVGHGFAGFIQKPYRYAQLEQILARALGRVG
jgi:two-component system cell cycle sensor histidine kinase/response regulator CckA